MTAPAKATTLPGQAVEVHPVGGRPRWRRRLAYTILIGYAILMFIPFAWSVITSFKTLPDSVNLNIFPRPFTTAGWEYALTKLDPPLPVLFVNSAIIAPAINTFISIPDRPVARVRLGARMPANPWLEMGVDSRSLFVLRYSVCILNRPRCQFSRPIRTRR